MRPSDAGDLINLIPRKGFVEMRGGYESFATNVGSGDVDLVVEYDSGSTQQFLAASSTNIYNITAGGGSPTSLGSGFTNGRWMTAIMNGVMAFVNGADTPQQWDGTTLSSLSVTGTGLTATDIIGVHIFKGRSYFWENNSQSFYYSAVNTLGGATTEFALGEIAMKGGRLLRMMSWTVDGGAGPDDYAVFIMDSGEVIVYQGDDPGASSSWGLVGIYDIGRPVSDRAMTKFGGEIALVNENDIVFLPSAFNQVSPPQTKLQSAIASAVDNFGNNDGWEVLVYQKYRLIMINVPTGSSPDMYDQYVMDLNTLAGCRFTNLPSSSWGLYQGNAYFGGQDGTVWRFNSTAADDGSDIDCEARMAWTDLGLPANKQLTSVRPVFEVEDSLSLGVAAGYDFTEVTASSPSSSASGGTPWGSSWGSPWGTSTRIQQEWQIVSGFGSHISLVLRFSRQGDTPRWLRTDWLVKPQGNL
ncbi:MAG: hypothetical protein KTR33_13875 [Gammaproteobacteria bacterium]|nr:hypothetical protein [Gammaproteobacteria bacterium]